MNCVNCAMYAGDYCKASSLIEAELKRPMPPAPLGSCILPIVDHYLSQIRPGMRVLDIGCGSWGKIRRHCEAVGATYNGIDVADSYFGEKSVATRFENLADLSFEDYSFDIVLSNQSMEHWAEFGCSRQWGLYQCFRVCKPGGRIFLNVPIYFHGTGDFILGRIDRIVKDILLFTDQLKLERWGQPSGGIAPVYPFPGYWRQANTPAYILDIQMVKTRATASARRPRFSPSGVLAQLTQYPLSFNLYRVLRKVGILGRA